MLLKNQPNRELSDLGENNYKKLKASGVSLTHLAEQMGLSLALLRYHVLRSTPEVLDRLSLELRRMSVSLVELADDISGAQ